MSAILEQLKAPRPGLKILVVEDESDIVTYLTTLFEDHGYSTCSACDGAEGLHKAISEKPDLITLDISMPEKSGVKLLTELQSHQKTEAIPIIIVTGVTPEFKRFIQSRKQVKPFAGYIEKPIDREKILQLIKDTLR